MARLIDIEDINEAPYNPRVKLVPGMAEYEKLERSIENFGFVVPLVWNERTKNLVGGHQRLTVLKNKGYTEVECTVVDLDEEEEKILNVALNKIKGEWNYDKLEELLKDFDGEVASLSGFAEEELAILLQSNADLLEDDEDWEDWEDEVLEEQEAKDNHVISLLFDDYYLAERWAESKNLQGHLHEGTATTVIRMGESYE